MPDIISYAQFERHKDDEELYDTGGSTLGKVKRDKLYLIYGQIRTWSTWGLCPYFTSDRPLAIGSAICVKRIESGVEVFKPVSMITYRMQSGSDYIFPLSMVNNFQGAFQSMFRYSWVVKKVKTDLLYGETDTTISDIKPLSIPNTHTRLYQQPFLIIQEKSDGVSQCVIGTACANSRNVLNLDQACKLVIPLSHNVVVFPSLIPI